MTHSRYLGFDTSKTIVIHTRIRMCITHSRYLGFDTSKTIVIYTRISMHCSTCHLLIYLDKKNHQTKIIMMIMMM